MAVPVSSQTKIDRLSGNKEWLVNCLRECSKARRELLGLDRPVRQEIDVSGSEMLKLTQADVVLLNKAYGNTE